MFVHLVVERSIMDSTAGSSRLLLDVLRILWRRNIDYYLDEKRNWVNTKFKSNSKLCFVLSDILRIFRAMQWFECMLSKTTSKC